MNESTYTPIPVLTIKGRTEPLEDYTKRTWILAKPLLQELKNKRVLTLAEAELLGKFMKAIHPVLVMKFWGALQLHIPNLLMVQPFTAELLVYLAANPYTNEVLHKYESNKELTAEALGFV